MEVGKDKRIIKVLLTRGRDDSRTKVPGDVEEGDKVGPELCQNETVVNYDERRGSVIQSIFS